MGNKPSVDEEIITARTQIRKAQLNVEVARIGQERAFISLKEKTKAAGKLGNMNTVKVNSQHLERIHKTKERIQLEANSLSSMEQDVILQQTASSTLKAMNSVTNVSNVVSSLQSLSALKARTAMYAEARERMRQHGDIMEEALNLGEETTSMTALDFEQQILDELAMEDDMEMPGVPNIVERKVAGSASKERNVASESLKSRS